MEEFPFQKVYDHFAHQLVMAGKVPEDIGPSLIIIRLKDGEIERETPLDGNMVGMFFNGSSGKALLGQFIRESMNLAKKMGESVGMVLMSEAYCRFGEGGKKEAEKIMKRGSLADDPEARECVMVTVYSPDDMRMGTLPMDENRNLTYAPLLFTDAKFMGSLTTNPEGTIDEVMTPPH